MPIKEHWGITETIQSLFKEMDVWVNLAIELKFMGSVWKKRWRVRDSTLKDLACDKSRRSLFIAFQKWPLVNLPKERSCQTQRVELRSMKWKVTHTQMKNTPHLRAYRPPSPEYLGAVVVGVCYDLCLVSVAMANGSDGNEYKEISRVRPGLKREFDFAVKSKAEYGSSIGRTRTRRSRHGISGSGEYELIIEDEEPKLEMEGSENTTLKKIPTKLKELLETELLEGIFVRVKEKMVMVSKG